MGGRCPARRAAPRACRAECPARDRPRPRGAAQDPAAPGDVRAAHHRALVLAAAIFLATAAAWRLSGRLIEFPAPTAFSSTRSPSSSAACWRSSSPPRIVGADWNWGVAAQRGRPRREPRALPPRQGRRDRDRRWRIGAAHRFRRVLRAHLPDRASSTACRSPIPLPRRRPQRPARLDRRSAILVLLAARGDRLCRAPQSSAASSPAPWSASSCSSSSRSSRSS